MAGTFTVFETNAYSRGTGKPANLTSGFRILNPATAYTLQIFNGGVNGEFETVSSARVTLNGTEIVASKELKQPILQKPVFLTTENELTVEVPGKPGSGIAIRILGADNDPPTIEARADPRPNKAGWNNTNVTVSFICADDISGIAGCPSPVSVETEGFAQLVSGTAVDKAGNRETVSVLVNVDKTPPSLSSLVEPEPNAAGWNRTDTTVSFTASDAVSGLDSVSAPVTITTEGGHQIVNGTATDRAGNVATATVSVHLDKTPPSIEALVSPPPNAEGWNNSEVTVGFDCQDSLSEIEDCSGPVLLTREGAAQKVEGSALDRAGNSAVSSVLVSLDKIPPVLDVSLPPDGATLNSTTVGLRGTVGENLSGVGNISCNGLPASVLGSSFSCEVSLRPGINPITLQGEDRAGNTDSLTIRLVRADTEDPVYPWPELPAGVASVALVLADLNGDGTLDLTTANLLTDNVSVLLGNGDHTFQSEQRFAVGDFPVSVEVAHFNDDGFSDIVTANAGTDDLSVLLGRGDGSFLPQQRFSVGDFPVSVAVGDLNNDGLSDVVTANAGSNDLSMLSGQGDGTFQGEQRLAVGDFPVSVALANLNHDGLSDAVAANAGSDELSVFLGHGDGTFATEGRIATGRFPVLVVVEDLNADGAFDLVTANVASDDVSVFLGLGDGAFQAQHLFPTGRQPFSLAVADVDRDGVLDLVTGNVASRDLSVLLGLGDGTFQPERRFAAGDYNGSVAVADLDNDGDPDVVAAKAFSADISVFDLSGSSPGGPPAGDIWVAPWGDDTAGTGSRDKPVRRIQRGVDLATPGSTVHLEPGSYVENVLIGKPLSLVGEGGQPSAALVHLRAASQTVNGGAVVLVQAANVTIKGLHITGGAVGIALASLSGGHLGFLDISNLNLTIVRNVIDNNEHYEIMILPHWEARNNSYRIINNTLIGNGRATVGIYANEHKDNPTRSQIRNNIIANHLGQEILELATWAGSKDIAYNLFYRWPRYVLMYNPQGITILYPDRGVPQDSEPSNNYFPNNLGAPPYAPETDPAFVQEAQGDYRIMDASAARDAGDPNLRDPLWNDPDGTRNDVGAFSCCPVLEWPNTESAANSDPWLAIHHSLIRRMRPRVLALNFVNVKSMDQMRAHMQQAIHALAEASRYHRYANPNAPVFLQYEIAYAVDLRDSIPPPDWPYKNSTRYPRESPVEGAWGFDYERLFTDEFTQLYAIQDPQQPGRLLSLAELIDRGLIHEVWIYADADVPEEVGGPGLVELKPNYDENRRRLPGAMNRCAGAGCFDEEDSIPGNRTVRIAFFNHARGVGCFLSSLAYGLESIGGFNRQNTVPYLERYFVPFAGFDLDTRYGLPFSNWYICPGGVWCLNYPKPTIAVYYVPQESGPIFGVIDPYDPVCGAAAWPPNGRAFSDINSSLAVRTSCEHYRDGTGMTTVFTGQELARYQNLAPDCSGRWLVWWMQNFPGLDNVSREDSGARMLNWWPFVFY